MIRPTALPFAASLLALLALAAGAVACQPADGARVRHPPLEAAALVQGLGGSGGCRADRDCAVGPSSGACVLGTCFGVLTTDNRAARLVLVDRLRHADAAVRAAATPLLRAELGRPSGARLAAIEGLGAVLEADRAVLEAERKGEFRCDDLCTAMRAQAAAPDDRLAVAARLALGRAGDPAVVAQLLDDLRLGTELLRAQAARALGPAVGRPGDTPVVAALVARLDDASAVVQEAALLALARAASRPEVRKSLNKLRDRGTGLGYAVDRVLAGAPQR